MKLTNNFSNFSSSNQVDDEIESSGQIVTDANRITNKKRILSKIQLLFLLFIILKFVCGTAYKDAIASNGLKIMWDFDSYYAAAERVNHKQPIYVRSTAPEVLDYFYSPFVAECLRPIAATQPIEDARRSWVLTNIALLIVSMTLFSVALNVRIMSDFLIILFTGFRFWPTVIEFGVGNVHMLLLVLVTGMYLAIRREKWMVLAFLIAMAATIKTWCIGLVIFLILIRKWREVAGTFGIFFAFMLGLFSYAGISELKNFLRANSGLIDRFTVHGLNASAATQQHVVHTGHHFLPISHSVFGMTRLYFTQNACGVDPVIDNSYLYIFFLTGFLLLVSGSVVYVGIFLRPHFSKTNLQVLFSLCTLTVLLTIPVCHVYTFVLALPSLWILLISSKTSLQKYREIIFALVAVVYFVLALPLPVVSPPEHMRHGLASMVLALPFLSVVGLWCTNAFVSLQKQA